LRRIVVLQRSDVTRLEPLSPADGAAALVGHAIRFADDRDTRARTLEAAVSLARAFPPARLHLALEGDPWPVLEGGR
jgi:hypothetical protein